MQKRQRHFAQAFTLLELAFVLTISGFLMSFIIPKVGQYLYFEKLQKTKTNQEQVFHALADFIVKKKRLPCPSDTSEQTIGSERQECQSNMLAQGIVPYRSLGLSSVFAKDGFGHYFTYAVEPWLAKDQFKTLGYDEESIYRTEESFCATPLIPELKLTNEQNQNVVQDNVLGALLISHGDKGEGSLLQTGQRSLLTQQNAIKQKNSDGSLLFIDKPYKNRSDDHIFWVTRDHLLSFYAKQPCVVKTNE